MKKMFAAMAMMVVSVSMVYAASDNGNWFQTSQSTQNPQVKYQATYPLVPGVDGMKFDGNVVSGGPGPVAGFSAANELADGWTSNWAWGFPFYFTGEAYSFTTASIIGHVLNPTVGTTAGLFMSTGYAWYDCGTPSAIAYVGLAGLTPLGSAITWTLPYTSSWLLLVGFLGFSPGTYDWVGLAEYEGEACADGAAGIFAPGVLGNGCIDITGGSNFLPTHVDADPGATGSAVGDGNGQSRPWCFVVTP